MQEYLAASEFIDWRDPVVYAKARALAEQGSIEGTVLHCFEFVRDQIKHTVDYQLNPVTLKASEVLQHGTGFCYAKSHLLAALLRANGVPTALCYQRFRLAGETFGLHGLNAVWLPDLGWYRLDPRGNKEGVDARFCPPVERLAFTAFGPGEVDSTTPYAEPLTVVINGLRNASTYQEVEAALPDQAQI